MFNDFLIRSLLHCSVLLGCQSFHIQMAQATAIRQANMAMIDGSMVIGRTPPERGSELRYCGQGLGMMIAPLASPSTGSNERSGRNGRALGEEVSG
jgi:hypothetical protein